MATRDELYQQYLAEKQQQAEPSRDEAYQQYLAEKNAPTMGDYAKDYAGTVLKATMDATEGMTDLAMLPANIAQRYYQGFENLLDEDPETGFWQGMGTTPPVGQATADFFNPAREIIKEDWKIPEGEAGWAYENVDRFSEHALPIVMSGGVGTVPTAGKLAGGATGQALSRTLQAGTRPAAAMSGAGAVAGHEIAGETGEQVGSLAGAIVGNPLNAAKWVGNRIKGGYQVVRPGSINPETVSPEVMREAVETYFRQAYPRSGDIADTDMKLLVDRAMEAMDRGESGTFAQLADDLGLRSFEEKLALESPERQRQLESIDRAIENQAQTRVDQVVEGDAALAKEAPLARTQKAIEDISNREIRQGDRALEQSRQAAEQARLEQQGFYTDMDSKTLNAANPSKTPITTTGKDGFKQLESNIATEYDDAWDKAGVLKMKTYNKMREYLEGSDAIDSNTYERIRKTVEEMGVMTPSQTSASVKVMDKVIRDEINRLPYDAYDKRNALKELRNILTDDMPKAGREKLAELNSNYDKFLTLRNTADRTQMGATPKVSDLEKSSRGLAPPGATMRDEAPMQDIIEEGLSAEQHLTEKVKVAEKELTQAGKTAQALRETSPDKVASRVAKQPVAKFTRNEGDYIQSARDVFSKSGGASSGSKTPVANMRQILKSARNQTDVANIKRAFLEEMQDTVFKLDKDGRVTAEAAKRFNARREAYEKSGMFSKEELDNIAEGVEQTQKLFLGDEAKAIAALPVEVSHLARQMAGVGGVMVGGSLTGGSHALMMAGRLRSMSEKLADIVGEKRIKELTFQLATNPARYKDVFKRYADDLSTPELQRSFMNELLARAGISTAQTQIED